MKPLLTLRALHIAPTAEHPIQTVNWDQSLGQLFDWIGDPFCWVTDRNNKIYNVRPENGPLPGTVAHPRWTQPLRGGVLIVAMDMDTGADAPLPLRDISAYRRQVRLTP